MKNFTFLFFVIMTFCCWGLYGPVLHVGQEAMAGGEGKASLRPFMCVGIAYFLIAVVYPLIVLKSKGETGGWSKAGVIWSFSAGVVGAVGALGIVLAFKFQGKPVFVMPLVFGLAPIVNTFATMLMAGTFKQASMKFYLAILIVALGAAGVMVYKPNAKHTKTTVNQSKPSESASEATAQISDKPPAQMLPVILCIAVTALSWGAYGPVLHKGQARMGGSRLRPFLCVGLAYFAIAVIAPIFLLGMFQEPGGFQHIDGTIWSLLAGAAGAIGALGIIYAFNFGGKPIYVMPLVFGMAPVVNTLTETVTKNLFNYISNEFLISLGLVIIGAVMVLIFAPRPKKKPVPNEPVIT